MDSQNIQIPKRKPSFLTQLSSAQSQKQFSSLSCKTSPIRTNKSEIYSAHLKQQSTKQWLQKRYKNKTKKSYIFNPQQIQKMEEIEEIFNSYDIGQKGQIEVSQLAIMFEENGVNVSEQDLRAIFNIVDDDKNGTLSLEEFKKFINSDDAQLKFRNIALQMRQRIEEDYQMFRIAEKQYLPLNFNKMLTYLFQKTVYRQTLKQLQSQDVQNKNTINDMHTFIKLFSGKNELVVESSNMIENQSVVTQFKSFNSVRESTTGGELDLNNQKTFTSDFFEPQLKALDLRHLSHQQQSYRSTNVSQNAIIEIDNLDSHQMLSSKRFSQEIQDSTPDVKIKRIRRRKIEEPQMNLDLKLCQFKDKNISESLVQLGNLSKIPKVKREALIKIPHVKLLARLEEQKKKVNLSPIVKISELKNHNDSLKSLIKTDSCINEKQNYRSFKVLPQLSERNLQDQEHRHIMNQSIQYLREGFRKQLKESNYIPGLSHHPLYNQSVKLSETLIPKRKDTMIKRGMFELVKIRIKDQLSSEQNSIESFPLGKPKVTHKRIQSLVDLQHLKACNILND